MITLFAKGGVLMWLIALCSVVGVAIFIERLLLYHRLTINTHEFIEGIKNALRRNALVEALSICDETPGPVAKVVKAAITKYDRSREEIQDAIEDVGLNEVPRLEKNLVGLATVAHVAPLIGLLGTVVGLISCFRVIVEKGSFVHVADMADGVWMALLNSAGGLAVAIPAYIAYNYLVSRVDVLVLDMERAATEILSFLTSSEKPGNNQPPRP
ncbi:MAG: MotA/TolQ/ExbB proton channel family protein [Verrucomicrobia bacterium]|nr:MotA/TolQ/ExbB proton channel family protein [Verrucomicrobiota bacterium]